MTRAAKGYHICLPGEAVERLERAATELGRPVLDLIETAAEEAALEFAKSRGWLTEQPTYTYGLCDCGLETKTHCAAIGCPRDK